MAAASRRRSKRSKADQLGGALITGGFGFAGRHLVDLLCAQGVETLAPPRKEVDFADEARVRRLVRETAPGAVFHLAAFSSATLSWKRPSEAVLGNMRMTLSVLEAVRLEQPDARLVLVGSGQVYGEPGAMPVSEDAPLCPANPYAASKASCDLLGLQYAEAFGLQIARMRPFNHAGPGQSEDYVVSSLARQVAEAEVGGSAECVVRTGNPESARDFTDVRDVVRAYAMAAEAGSGPFNVCSGKAVSVATLVEMLGAHSRVPIKHEIASARLRDHDASVLYGSHERLTAACGWEPKIPLETTVRDTIDWWRTRVGA